MMWKHIILEGFCFGEKDSYRPCGRGFVSTFCLGNGHCPHFAYAEVEEREVAQYVPLWLILWDKMQDMVTEFYWNLRDRFFSLREPRATFLEHVEKNIVKCPAWEISQAEAEDKFPEWLKEVVGKEDAGWHK